MSSRNSVSAVFLATSLIFMATTAHAGDAKIVYGGISGGEARVDDLCNGVAEDVSCEDTAISARVYAGAALNDYLSYESGYSYVSEMEAGPETLFKASTDVHLFDSTLMLGTSRNYRLQLFAKAGFVLWWINTDFSGGQSLSSDGVSLRSGLGARLGITDSFALRFDWDYFDDVGKSRELVESDVHVFSAGPEFVF